MFKLKFLNSKKNIVFIIISLILLVTLSSILLYFINQQAFDQKNIDKVIKETLQGDTPVGYFPSYENDLVKKYDAEIILSKYDLFKPTYSVLGSLCIYENNTKPKQDCNSFFVIEVYLQRTGLVSWKNTDLKRSFVDNISYNQLKDYVKKQDIYKNNPDAKNIRNVEPLTQSEIDNNRRLRESEENEKRVAEQYKTDTLEGRLSLCKDNLDDFNKLLEAKKRGDKTYQTKNTATLVQLDTLTLESLQSQVDEYRKGCGL